MIVVSQLISLMQDQVQAMIERNVTVLAHATFLRGLAFLLSSLAVYVPLVEERCRKENS